MVYLIDDTGSQRYHREELKRIFWKLLAVHQTTDNVRVAALAHGDITRTDDELDYLELFPHERDSLGRGYPELFTWGFTEPKHITPQHITVGIDSLTLLGRREYLYPGIALAQKMIETECKNPPWCERKVIVVVGDGNPGQAAPDYFSPRSYALPKRLLDSVAAAEIELHTLCLGAACTNQITVREGSWLHFDRPSCTNPPGLMLACIGHSGDSLMAAIARRSYKGGKYY